MIEVRVPMVVKSPNVSLWAHWAVNVARIKKERRMVGFYLHKFKPAPPLPVKVTMIRCAPRELDSDNLVGAFKHTRDEIAAFLGSDDRNPRISWHVEQRKVPRKEAGTLIRIEEAA